MPAPASRFGTSPSQAPQLQRIQERSTDHALSKTSLKHHCDRLEGLPAPKEKPGTASWFRSGNGPRLGVANVERARLRTKSPLRILHKPVPESLLLRRGSPV